MGEFCDFDKNNIFKDGYICIFKINVFVINLVVCMIKNIVFIYIGGCNISVLVDLGVFVLIINRDFLGKIFYVNDELLLLEFNLVKGVSGRLLLVIGKLNVEFLLMVRVIYLWFILCFYFRSRFLCVYDIVFRFLKENIMFILDV